LLDRKEVKVALPLITTGFEPALLHEREKADQLAILSGGQDTGMAFGCVFHALSQNVKHEGTKGPGIFQLSGAPVPWGLGNSVERGQKEKDSLKF
jgi:hypothetical protein